MLDFIASFLTAALSATGVGGGGLLVLYLRLVKNTEQLSAQGINLIFFVFSSVSASVIHLIRRKLPIPRILGIGIAGFFGSFLGLLLLRLLDVSFLTRAFGGLMAVCGIHTFFAKKG